MSTEQENRENILRPYIRLEPGRHSPVNVDLANSFWERTTNKFLAVLGLMDTKVRMEDGKGLSDQNFTLEEKEKLAGLESSHYRGTYDSLSSLQSNVLNPVAGDYADVDGGAGHITSRYLWDPTDNHWEQMIGESTQLTGSQVKVMYESQPDTNVFDDNAKNKLTGISSGATKNQTDSHLLDRANHTGTQPVSTITGLGTAATGNVVQGTGNSQTDVMSQKASTDALATKVGNSDSRLTDSREWTATTVTQEEAEEGTESTRRAWTAQRVWQAINAWWQLVTSGFGRNFISATNEQAARNLLELGTAALSDVTHVTGASLTEVMSQKAVTDALTNAGTIAPSSAAYEYDSMGQVNKIVTPQGDTVIGYNPNGTVETITYPTGRVETFTYHISGNVISMTATGG